MTVKGLLDQLSEIEVTLSLRDEELIVQGRKRALTPALIEALREHKQALIELIKAGGYAARPARRESEFDVPPNRIPPGCEAVEPDMLPLVALTQQEIDAIAAQVPGGMANIQDIYPLAPLQEGMLFHHLSTSGGDMYLAPSLYAVDSRARLDASLPALQATIDRHDILRTAVFWAALSEPVQVVLRRAPLALEEVALDPAEGDIAAQLLTRFDPRRHRIDLRRAPLLRLIAAHDASNRRWVVLWLNHHLVSDAVTAEVMLQEVGAHLLGQAATLPVPLPFRNVVAHARRVEHRDAHEAFFRTMLGDVFEPTRPFGLMSAHGDGSTPTSAREPLASGLDEQLRACARTLNVSTASLFHLAWAQVLARASGEDDVVFGTVLVGRMQGGAGTERAVGLLMNTLPVRVRIDEADVLTSVRETHRRLAELLHHEHASLALAQRCSGVAAPAPLFTALLNYRHAAGGMVSPASAVDVDPSAAGWRRLALEAFDKTTNYALTLNVDDLGDGFVLEAQTIAPIAPERVCASMRTALEQLVQAIARAPHTPIRDLDVMPEAERHQLLMTWNATDADYPRDAGLHELIDALAAREPDADAIVDGDRRLGFASFVAQANRLAHFLVSRGVRAGDRVAILLERSIDLIVAQLAVLKCGAAFVVLDRSAPDERQRFIVRDCGAAIVLSTSSNVLPQASGVARIDLDTLLLDGLPEHSPNAMSGGGMPAYVSYTSGSTGEPKGVVVPHRAVARVALNNGWAQIGAGDRFACLSNPAWDASTLEVWVALLNGACVVAIDQETVLAPARLCECLLRYRVTVAWFAVGLFNQYADVLSDVLPRLRYALVGGDALDPRIIARVMRECRPRRLINGYGPTETTVFAATHAIEDVPDGVAAIPIGRPISNTTIYILDTRGRLAPVGAIGEIHIGGDGVALGYLNRPELTARRFVDDPFSMRPGARLYKSGDLGRYLPDGRIVYMGRNDFQVKIRGFRIELGEIEACLGQHPAVREVAVLAREDDPGEKRLVAYYTVARDAELSAQALRAHAADTLPDYMVPAAYVAMDALPLTINGKLDRRALPAPQAPRAADDDAPAGDVETSVARIWADVLKVDAVGRHDDFFDLGGHSLLAVRVASAVRQTLGVDIGVTELFLRPVLCDFSEKVAQAVRSELVPIAVIPRDGMLPLSFAQQRLWFLAQLEGVSRAYHVPLGLLLRGRLERVALRRALDRIVMRHEVLRTTFAVEGGMPVQRVARPDVGFALREADLADADGLDVDKRAAAERWIEDEAKAPFDLETGPLARGQLIRIDSDTHLLLITLHHIVADAWSLGVLTRELSALYRAYCLDQGDPLPVLTVQYPDFAAWQRQSIGGEQLQAQAQYWQSVLADAPACLTLPFDRPRPVLQDHAGAAVAVQFDAALTARLKRLSQRHGTTLFMTLLAAWAVLLGRLAGQDSVVVGTPAANRGRAELEPLIGLFLNTLALRVDLPEGMTVGALLAQAKAATVAAQANQDLPFEQVVELVKPPRNMAHSPVFQVMFGWRSESAGDLELPGLEVSPVGPSHEMAKFDLSLNLVETGDEIAGTLVYATALFEHDTIERYVGYLHTLLIGMTVDDDASIGTLPLVGDEERRRLLIESQAAQAALPPPALAHALVEAQAMRTPDALAVVHGNESLTYAQLNAHANRLAHHLRAAGLAREQLVGICVARSIDMLVAVLGVLKAGGAYVPLDPAYPRERLAQIVQDSAPAFLLTHERLRASLPPHTAVTMLLDAQRGEIAKQPAHDPTDRAQAHNLAYVIHTSGSTGRAKGVMIEHRALGNLLEAMGEAPGIVAADALLAVTSLSFDIAGLELLLPLTRGAKVVIAAAEAATDPRQLAELIVRHDVTIMQATPATWRMLLTQDWRNFSPRFKVLCGGEALPRDLAVALLARVPLIWNLYGPTETTIWSSAHCMRADAAGTATHVSIGRPIANTQIHIVDRAGQPVPIGVAGELVIGGVGLARGYLDQPALTAERFIDSPDLGCRVYRTGDLARCLADGTLDYLGRLDHQVKIRGFRIEPAEIETALAAHPGVAQSAVVAHENAGETYLAAYVVPGAAAPVTAEQGETQRGAAAAPAFSLFYFGAHGQGQGDGYRLYLEAARFADTHGLEAVWTPERHFHEVGGLYPNPAVLSAALAGITHRVQLRSGSVVLPLHHPVRVAEEWSVVDNLSGGRTGISIASGWHPRDFALAPDRYDDRKTHMVDGIAMLRALWRGDPIQLIDGAGKPTSIRLHPLPLQTELPLWITSAGNPDTVEQAGALGANLLTHLLGQTIEDVADTISLYRAARARHGHDPDGGKVTVMVHCYLGEDGPATLERAREPFVRYMRAHLGLLEAFAKSLDVQTEALGDDAFETIVNFAFERYTRTAALIGTPADCLPVVQRLHEAGVDEIACLIDWMDTDDALAGLPHLHALQERARQPVLDAAGVRRHLKARLPDYMLPANVTFLDRLPLTPSGKLDRRALPAPRFGLADAEAAYEAPRTEAELTLAHIWREVLGVERVGRHDNFFELGGHSLLAVVLVERLRAEGWRADIRTLFATPSLAEMAVATERTREIVL